MTTRTAHTIGAKYDDTLDIRDIARLVRSDIKVAKKDGSFPGDAKVSVTISRYSMGQSLNVHVTLPDRPARVPADDPRARPYQGVGYAPETLYTIEAEDIIAAVNRIVAQYNYDNSDTQTDCFDVNFYSHVTVGGCPDV